MSHCPRVLHLMSSLEMGGAERLLIDLLAEESRRTPRRVEYACVIMNDRFDGRLLERLEATGFPAVRLHRPPGRLHPRYLFRLLEVIRDMDADLVHSHNPGGAVWSSTCRLLRPHLRTVHTIHDTRVVPALRGWERWIHRSLVSCHVAVSRSVAAECGQHGLAHVQQIYNGIRLTEFAPAPPSQILERPLRIVNVARMTYPKKGQDVLLRALRRCREASIPFRCTFVASVHAYDSHSLSEMRAMCVEFGISDDVEFLLDRADVPAILSRHNLFVLPSRYEGLGLVVLEAMAAGVPVICSDIDGPRELVEDGRTGLLFPVADDEALFERLRRAHESPEVMASLARAASAAVLRFDVARMADEYAALYAGLAGRP